MCLPFLQGSKDAGGREGRGVVRKGGSVGGKVYRKVKEIKGIGGERKKRGWSEVGKEGGKGKGIGEVRVRKMKEGEREKKKK